MGLATIDPHSQKEHTEIHKIPKFGVDPHTVPIRRNLTGNANANGYRTDTERV